MLDLDGEQPDGHPAELVFSVGARDPRLNLFVAFIEQVDIDTLNGCVFADFTGTVGIFIFIDYAGNFTHDQSELNVKVIKGSSIGVPELIHSYIDDFNPGVVVVLAELYPPAAAHRHLGKDIRPVGGGSGGQFLLFVLGNVEHYYLDTHERKPGGIIRNRASQLTRLGIESEVDVLNFSLSDLHFFENRYVLVADILPRPDQEAAFGPVDHEETAVEAGDLHRVDAFTLVDEIKLYRYTLENVPIGVGHHTGNMSQAFDLGGPQRNIYVVPVRIVRSKRDFILVSAGEIIPGTRHQEVTFIRPRERHTFQFVPAVKPGPRAVLVFHPEDLDGGAGNAFSLVVGAVAVFVLVDVPGHGTADSGEFDPDWRIGDLAFLNHDSCCVPRKKSCTGVGPEVVVLRRCGGCGRNVLKHEGPVDDGHRFNGGAGTVNVRLGWFVIVESQGEAVPGLDPYLGAGHRFE